jgi:hypothetical protein
MRWVVLALAVLVAGVHALFGPGYTKGSSPEGRAEARMALLVDVARSHRRDHGRPPETLDDLRREWQGLPLTDEWGRSHEVAFDAQGVTVRSVGPDGERDTGDDLIVGGRWFRCGH